MARQSLKYRKLIVPFLCVALVGTQFFVSAGAYDSQINHIEVSRTVSKFVAPVSQLGLATLERMKKFASLAAPESELPERDWLLDDSAQNDSEVPELAIHRTDAAIGDLAAVEGDAWSWLGAVAAAAATVAAATLSGQTPTFATAVVAFTATANLANNERREEDREDEQQQAEDEAAAAEEAADEAAAAEAEAAREEAMADAETATADTELLTLLEELTATDDATADQFVEQTNQLGLGYNRSKTWNRIVQKKREMMLSFELDALILAAM